MALALVNLIKVKLKPSAIWRHIKWTFILMKPTSFPCGFETWWDLTRLMWHEFLTGHSGSCGRDGQDQFYIQCGCGRRFAGMVPGIYELSKIKI